jgi:hypothetical protein
MYIPPLLSHNMLRYYDMFDDILSLRNTQAKFMLSSEEKRQQVIDQMLSSIVSLLNKTAIQQAEESSITAPSYLLIHEQERKSHGTPT